MDMRSILGYSVGSPFNNNPLNIIQHNTPSNQKIEMRNSYKPLIALDGSRGTSLLNPGSEYKQSAVKKKFQAGGNQTSKSTQEIPMEMLPALEPILLQKHLSTLKKAQKDEFMIKFTPLDQSMRRAALMQMLAKYPEVVASIIDDSGMGYTEDESIDESKEQEYQAGGEFAAINANNQILADRFNRKLDEGFVLKSGNQKVRSKSAIDSLMSPNVPLSPQDSLYLNPFEVLSSNAVTMSPVMEQFPPYPVMGNPLPEGGPSKSKSRDRFREKKMGGELSRAKAEKMLHDGTVRGKKITDKQRRYFAAVAYGDKKQVGGETDDQFAWKPVMPFEGWRTDEITSNRPTKSNTIDVSDLKHTVRKSNKNSATNNSGFLAPHGQAGNLSTWEPIGGSPVNMFTAPHGQAGNRKLWEPFPQPNLSSKTATFSNTTAAIAATTKDPLYKSVFGPSMLRNNAWAWELMNQALSANY